MKVTWVIATLFTIVLCGALSGPVVCKDLVSCNQSHQKDQDLRLYSALIAAALVAVLLQEAAAVALTHNTARKAIHLIPNIKESLLPSLLLCVTFVVLLVENLPMVIGDVPWFAHAANLNRSDLHEQPVYTIFYAEWVVNVPILLVMAGSISLGRSAVEVGEPLLITNIYIVLAWVAHFIPNVPLRYTVVSVTWKWFVNFFVSPPGFKWCSVFDMFDFWISVSHASFAWFCQNEVRTLFNWDVFWEYPGTLNNYIFFHGFLLKEHISQVKLWNFDPVEKSAFEKCVVRVSGLRKILVLWKPLPFPHWRSRCLSWCISELLGLCACGWCAGEGGTPSAAWFPRGIFFKWRTITTWEISVDLKKFPGIYEGCNWRFMIVYHMMISMWFKTICIFLLWLNLVIFHPKVIRFCFKFCWGHILGRPLLSFVLIIVFGIYGLVYLGRLHGLVSYRNERIFYTTMNFTTKLFASMTLAGIRSSEFQEVLLTMLANTQTSFKRAVNYEDHTPLLSDWRSHRLEVRLCHFERKFQEFQGNITCMSV